MTREHLQTNYQDMKTYLPWATDENYSINSTSGSTGQPVKVWKYSPDYLRGYQAITLLEWEWHQRSIKKKLGAFRIGIEDRPIRQLGSPLNYLGDPSPGFEFRSDGRSPVQLIEFLIEHQPDYLFCNAITLRLIASELKTGSYPKLKIEQLLTVSDPIGPAFRAEMKRTFGAKCVDRYSSEEFGIFALQCPTAEHLHVISTDFVVEVVNEQGIPVRPGEVGKVLVTWLTGRAMPLVRYQIGDLARQGEQGSCDISWPILTEITGRIRDWVELPDGTKTIATFVYSKLSDLSELYDFQTILFSDAVYFVAGVKQALSDRAIAAIRAELARIFGAELTIYIVESDQLPLLRMHKRPEFIRVEGNFSPDFEHTTLFEHMFE